MTQDCSLTLSIADENKSLENKRFPKGIHVTETDAKSGSGIEEIPHPKAEQKGKNSVNKDKIRDESPWSYLMIHNKLIETFKKQVETYNHQHPDVPHKCFVHYTYKYKQKDNGKGVIKKQQPTISGLVFLQGEVKELQTFLQTNYPHYHLVNDCSTGQPASISHKMMLPFMQVVSVHPENVTFLRDPFIKFAKDHVKLRVLTGLFKGMEGYIVRVDRDRQLIMELGGYAVAIRGVHKEDFAVVEP